MHPYRLIKLAKQIAFALLVVCLLFYLLAPFYWAVNSSLQKGSDLFSVHFLPPNWAWENYKNVFLEQPFGRNIINSVLVSILTVALSTLLALTASFCLGRLDFRGRKLSLLAILSVSMFPQVALLSGLYELITSMGLYDHLGSLVLSYLIFTLPFTIWVITSFIKAIPKEIEEAAIMDGAKPWTILIRVFLPLLAPALVTTSLLAFIAAWNEFLLALTFTLDTQTRTVPVAIALMSGASQYELPWGQIMAASVLVTLPLILLVLVFQRWIVSGLTAGAVKG